LVIVVSPPIGYSLPAVHDSAKPLALSVRNRPLNGSARQLVGANIALRLGFVSGEKP
jgi:hypothetical protein